MKALLEANADPMILDKMNRSVLEYAQAKKQSECALAIEVSRVGIPVNKKIEHAIRMPLSVTLRLPGVHQRTR